MPYPLWKIKMKTGFFKKIGDILKGMLFYEYTQSLYLGKKSKEDLFNLILYGQLIGIPIFMNFYSMKLMPYLVKEIHEWRFRILREKDIFELISD